VTLIKIKRIIIINIIITRMLLKSEIAILILKDSSFI